MNLVTTRVRKGAAITLGAAGASAALVLGGVTSASAADTQFGPGDVAGFENAETYNQWHIGSVAVPGTASTESLTFGDCSVTFKAPPAPSSQSDTQLLQGIADEGRESIEEIRSLFDSLEVAMQTGNNLTLQVPLIIYPAEGASAFTTVRTVTGFDQAGTSTFAGTPLTSSRPAVLGDFADSDALLEELQSRAEDGATFELLGYGVAGEPDAIINSVTALGNTSYFGNGDCLPDQGNGGEGDGNGDGGANDGGANDGDATDNGATDGDDAAGAPKAPTRPTAVDTGL